MKRLLALLLVLTVAFCAPAAAETARRPLASGDTGDAVVELQKRLQSLGLSTGEADGIYGKQTLSLIHICSPPCASRRIPGDCWTAGAPCSPRWTATPGMADGICGPGMTMEAVWGAPQARNAACLLYTSRCV